MPAKKNEASSMRNFFGLQAAASVEPDTAKIQGLEPSEVQPAPVETVEERESSQAVATTSIQQQPPHKSKLPTGRPISNVERVPITLSVKSDTDAAIAELTNIMQSWRGRRRGVAKVGRNDVVDFAIEYLLERINKGETAAENFYRQRESDEHNSSNNNTLIL